MDNNVINNNQIPQNNNIVTPPGAYYIPYTPPPKKEYTPLSKKENRFIFIALAGLLLFIDFAVFHGFSLGFTISFALVFAITSAFIYKKDAKHKAFSFICGAFSLVLSIGNTLYNNPFLKFASVLVVGFLFAIYCLGISGGIDRLSGSYKMLIELFLKTAITPLDKLGEVFGSIKAGAKANKKGLGVLLGIGLSLPVLAVVIPLLVSGDAAFEGLVFKVLENIGIYLVEIAIAIVALPFFYSYLFSRKRCSIEEKAKKKSDYKRFPFAVSASFLSMISITYLVYLFSQLAYFFSAFKGILPDGYTHTASAFARRGFYEMCAICFINIALISIVSILCERKNKKLPAFMKALSLFISMFSVLLVVIAIQKMRLNIATYGLSVNRLLVCAFMLMMLVVIAFFILHIFAPKVNYMQPIIIICAVIFIALTFADIDRIAADYNINAYTSGKLEMLDVEAIADMSDSAVPYLISLTQSKDEKIAEEAKYQLFDRIYYQYELYDDSKQEDFFRNKGFDFRVYNKSEYAANKAEKKFYNSLSGAEKEELINGTWDYEEDKE